MEPTLLTLVALAPPAALLLHTAVRNRAEARAWSEAAAALGLERGKPRRVGRPRPLTGQVGEFRIRVEAAVGGNVQTTVVDVYGAGYITVRLRLRLEGLDTRLAKASEGEDLLTGDAAFDAKVYIRGETAPTLALLDAETRHLLLHMLVKRGVRVEGGRLIALRRGRFTSSTTLVSVVREMVALGERLVQFVDVPARLARIIHEDPEPGVRLRCLQVLIDYHGREPQARATLRAVTICQDEELRLRAAVALGAEGHPVLLEIASRVEGAEDRAARAIASLGPALAYDRGLDILEAAVSGGRPRVALAALECLTRPAGPEAVSRLAPLVAGGSPALAAAAVRALGAVGQVAAERVLLTALVSPHNDVRLAGAQALGEVGSADTVLPLRSMAARSDADRGLRSAARQAIARIQSRVPGAAPGQLSVSDGDAGQLSLDEERGGRVTVAETGGTE